MKRIIQFIILTGFIVSAATAVAGDVQDAEFYKSRLYWKIICSQSKAEKIESNSQWMREYAKLNQEKAEFFMQNRNELVKEMEAADLPKKAYKVDRFINARFFESLEQQNWLASN